MNDKNIIQKLCSILIVLILSSAIPLISPSKALSVWEQTTVTDFDNGTFDNTTIESNGFEAKLYLLNVSGEWEEKKPVNKPCVRYAHLMSSIWGTDKVLLFGGNNHTTTRNYFNDSWLYDSIWGTDNVVLFGGGKITSYYDETWVFDLGNNTWTKKMPSTNPGYRYLHEMSSIWGTDKVVLFGGYSSFGMTDETWVYDLSDDNWTKKQPVSKPIGRPEYAMSHIWGTDKVALFGGRGQTQVFNDIWIYDLSDDKWTEKEPVIKPYARYGHKMVSPHGTDKVITFSGRFGNIMGETWEYDFSDNFWKKIKSSTSPSYRFLYGLAQVYGTSKAVLFGGYGVGFFDDTWIYTYNQSAKHENGTYISTPYDTRTGSSFKMMNWSAITTINTSVKFQFKTALTKDGLNKTNYIGPDGTTSTYYIAPSSMIWNGHYDDIWMQYIVYLNTTNVFETPILENVSITYNNLPFTSMYGPDDGAILATNKPVFIWNFTDLDSLKPGGFQLLIDDNSNFMTVNFDSGEQKSSNETWQFPNGTGNHVIPEGTWYWKIRSMDEDGDWSDYTEPWKIIIDTIAPASVTNMPENNTAYNNLNMISGTASDPVKSSGLSKVEISIKRLNDTFYWDGAAWTAGEKWLLTLGTADWSYDTYSIAWSSGTTYTVRSRAADIATNVESPGAGITFIIDFDNPYSTGVRYG
jgi:hypothetical protein